MRHLYQLLLFTLIVVLCLLGLVTTVAVTHTGSNWFVRWLIETNDLPLEVQTIRGRLADNLIMQGVRYQDDGRVIDIETVELAWHPGSLLRGSADIEKLQIEKIVYKDLPVSENEDERLSFDISLPEIEAPSLPFAVNVANISVRDGSFIPIVGESSSFSMEAALQMDADKLALQLLQLQVAEQQLRGSVLLDNQAATPVAVDINWSGRFQDVASKGTATLVGSQQALAISLASEGALKTDLKGDLQLLSAPYAYALAGQIDGPILHSGLPTSATLAPVLVELTGNLNELNASLTSALDLNGVKTSLDAEMNLLLPGKRNDNPAMHIEWRSTPGDVSSALALDGIGDIELVNNKLVLDHLLQGPGKVRLSGAVELSEQDVDLLLEWNELNIPIADRQLASSAYGTFTIKGAPESLTLSLQSAYRYTDSKPQVPAIYEGTINTDGRVELSSNTPVVMLEGAISLPQLESMQRRINSVSPLDFKLEAIDNSLRVDMNLMTTTLDNKNYSFNLNTNTNLQDGNNTSIDWLIKEQASNSQVVAGNGTIVTDAEAIVIQHQSSVPFATRIEGRVVTVQEGPASIDLALQWDNIDLSELSTRSLMSETGELSVTGTSDDLQINADSKLVLAPLGNIDVTFDGGLKQEQFVIDMLRLGLLQGEIKGSGELLLTESKTGELRLQATGLDFAQINKDMASAINIDATLKLSRVEQQPSLAISIPSLDGTWREKPLRGNAELFYADEKIDIRPFRLSLQDNVVEANLTSADTLSGNVVIDLVDLASFSNELAGSIKGEILLGGNKSTPQLNAVLQASNLFYDSWRVGELDSLLDIDLNPGETSELTVTINTLRYKDAVLDNVSINGGGLTEDHQINISASAEALQLAARLEAGLKQRRWLGKVSEFSINSTDYGQWQLNQPMSYSWQTDNNSFAVEETCFNSSGASACLQASADERARVSAWIELNQLPLSLVNDWLPATLSLQGLTAGKIVYEADNGDWQTMLDLSAGEARLGMGYGDDIERIDLSRAVISSRLSNSSRQIDLSLVAPSYFDLDMQGQMLGKKDAPLSARLKLRLPDISWLEKIEPTMTGTRGAFDLTLDATGSMQQPQVMGEFQLKNGAISILPLGLNIDSVEGDIHSNEGNGLVQFDTRLATKDKQLALNGDVMLDPDQGYPYRFSLMGKNFPLIRTADIRLDISPELKLSGDTSLHKIRGSITVPLLNVIVSTLPESAVSVSPDVVIVQSQQADAVYVQEVNGSNKFMEDKLDVDVSVVLDPDIHLSGFGVDASLTGDLRLTKPGGVAQPRAQGQVTVKEGSYNAYGQNLVIEEGRILFAGPVDNPALNVRAFRPELPVKAGVNVTGSIRQPTLTLYSDPAQTESDTLSYIITGRPLGDASGSEASLIARAALSLGAKESSMLTGEIAEMFNLDEVSVGAGDTLESTSLTASKKITKDLTFKTAFNPFDQLWSFLLNYKLTENWSVQSETGVRQGADIIYSIQSNKFKELYRKLFDILTFASEPLADERK